MIRRHTYLTIQHDPSKNSWSVVDIKSIAVFDHVQLFLISLIYDDGRLASQCFVELAQLTVSSDGLYTWRAYRTYPRYAHLMSALNPRQS